VWRLRIPALFLLSTRGSIGRILAFGLTKNALSPKAIVNKPNSTKKKAKYKPVTGSNFRSI
jgi:hypothetical protein